MSGYPGGVPETKGEMTGDGKAEMSAAVRTNMEKVLTIIKPHTQSWRPGAKPIDQVLHDIANVSPERTGVLVAFAERHEEGGIKALEEIFNAIPPKQRIKVLEMEDDNGKTLSAVNPHLHSHLEEKYITSGRAAISVRESLAKTNPAFGISRSGPKTELRGVYTDKASVAIETRDIRDKLTKPVSPDLKGTFSMPKQKISYSPTHTRKSESFER